MTIPIQRRVRESGCFSSTTAFSRSPGDVGVDLGGGDVGVAEQGLHRAQIGAALQQVGGEGVAQDVRTDLGRVDAGPRRRLVEQLGEAPRGQPAARAP